MLSTYASASYDPSNVSVQSFCLISSDGRAISVVGATYLDLENLNTNPRLTSWRQTAVSVLRSGSGKFEDKFQCIPTDTRSWSDTDRAAAVGFLEAIRAPEVSNDPSLTETHRGSAAGVLVLAVTGLDQHRVVVVPTLLVSDDAMTVTKAIKSKSPWEFTSLLSEAAAARKLRIDNHPVDYVCVVGSDGRAFAFNSAGTTDSWQTIFDPAWSARTVQDAIVVIRNSEGYHGSFICSLEKSVQWPDEMRSEVIEFLEKLLANVQTRNLGGVSH